MRHRVEGRRVSLESGCVPLEVYPLTRCHRSKRFSRLKTKYEKDTGNKIGGGTASPTKAGSAAADGEEETPKKKATKKATPKKRKAEVADDEADDEDLKTDAKRVKTEDGDGVS